MTSTIACQKKNDSKQNQNSNIFSPIFLKLFIIIDLLSINLKMTFNQFMRETGRTNIRILILFESFFL